MIVDNFKEIRRRMLGDQKAKQVVDLEPVQPCSFCHGSGWLIAPYNGQNVVCPVCFNPKGLPCP